MLDRHAFASQSGGSRIHWLGVVATAGSLRVPLWLYGVGMAIQITVSSNIGESS